MSQKSAPNKVDIFKVDSKDVEIVDGKNYSNTNTTNNTPGKEIATIVALEATKAVAPVAIDYIKGIIEDDREEKRKIREDSRVILQRDFNNLIQNIEKEEATILASERRLCLDVYN